MDATPPPPPQPEGGQPGTGDGSIRPSPLLRRTVLVAAGLAALAVGAWWRARRSPPAAPPSAPDDAALSALWAHEFDTPGGPRFKLADLQGRHVLLNFWAPWCPPCVKEMPLLDQFRQEFGAAGWEVVGLAVDNAQPVRDFLAHHPVRFPIALAGYAGTEWAAQLGNAAGGLPFSVVLGPTGSVLQRHSGSLKWSDLVAWASTAASRTPVRPP